MPRFHPDLTIARVFPPIPFGPRSTALMNAYRPKPKAPPEDLLVDDVAVPGPDGAPPVPLRIYRPRILRGAAPALLWIHGGGMISGSPLMDERTSIAGFTVHPSQALMARRRRWAAIASRRPMSFARRSPTPSWSSAPPRSSCRTPTGRRGTMSTASA